MPSARELTTPERDLIGAILGATNRHAGYAERRVVPLDDGGMGSLRFVSELSGRRFGGELGVVEFNDADGQKVIATLIVDQFGELYDLEIWKVDFSPLQRIPPPSELRRFSPSSLT